MIKKAELNEKSQFVITKKASILKVAESYDAVMAFSHRTGGCSSAPYESLNFSSTNGDAKTNVSKNFQILSDYLGIESSQIITCEQVHGDNVAILDHPPETSLKADAIIATNSGLYPAIKTADCLPILIIDPTVKIAAAVHAGWRGTVLRILRKVVQTLNEDYKCKKDNLIIALGPAIGSCCYEVDQKVLEPLFSAIPWAVKFTKPTDSAINHGSGKRYLDLVAINHNELVRLGIPSRNIHSAQTCTCCSKDMHYSFRRDGKSTGRGLAITGFKHQRTWK